MKILYASSEVVPFVKTGGLADVAGALPKKLAEKGHDVRVFLPLYKAVSDEIRKQMKFIKDFHVDLDWRKQHCGVFLLEAEGVKYYFIDNEYYFKRDGLYSHGDDGERFAYFSKAVIDSLKEIDFCPDVINANDWQTALIPTYLKLNYSSDPFYNKIKTVLTIHNIGYQGRYGAEILERTVGINKFFFETGYIEHQGDVNYLKAGLLSADAVNTVSRTYAEELKTDYYSHGLAPILRYVDQKLTGILNGIDVDFYDPETNKSLFFNFNARRLASKEKNKKELLRLLNLEYKKEVPVIGIVSRFVDHKGFDLIENVLDDILQENVKLVVLGTGDYKYERMFNEAQRRYPNKISVNVKFSEDLANKIYAGSDLFLMPSISEPCGLSQMISMRYGTLPIVRETGGLSDTVECYRPDLKAGDGFSFKNINAHDMLYVIKAACDLFTYDRDTWNSLVKSAMKKDFSWDKSADEYLKLYEKICEN